MSTVDIYIFDEDGYASYVDHVLNANLGPMMVWQILEKKYLPSLPFPNWWDIAGGGDYYSRLCLPICIDDNGENLNKVKEIMDLVYDPRLSDNERIVLETTFEQCLVKSEDLPMLIEAFCSFDGKTNLPDQAAILQTIISIPEIIAVGFGISLADSWTTKGLPDPDPENPGGILPYNIFKQTEHWFLDKTKWGKDKTS
jgi:hypothetical protein